jgi:hypothetical protein
MDDSRGSHTVSFTFTILTIPSAIIDYLGRCPNLANLMGGRSALQQKHRPEGRAQRRIRAIHSETSAIYHNTHTPPFPNMRLILFTDRTTAGCDSRAG